MGRLTDLSYNYHKNSAESYIKRKLNFNEKAFNQFKQAYTKELDAFYNAYAESNHLLELNYHFELNLVKSALVLLLKIERLKQFYPN